MNKHISQTSVKKAKQPTSGYYIVFDDKIEGFGLRVTAAGAKSFVLNYRVSGRKRRYTIGRWPQWTADAARDEVITNLWPAIHKGGDPQHGKEIERGEPMMKELADDYIEQWAIPHKKPSSVKQDRRMLNTRVLPALGKLRVKAVTTRDIEKLHNSLRRTPYEANRVKSLLSKIFSCAIKWKMRDENPCKGIKRFDEPKHEFWLSVEQFQRLERALNEYEPQWAADAIRLLALTGCREGEGLTATWPQFDLQRGTWTKPSHATKEKKTEIIPLNGNALTLLSRMAKQRDPDIEWLFPSDAKRKKIAAIAEAAALDGGKRAHTTLRNAWRIVCRNAGLATQYYVKGKRGKMLKRWKPTIRINDLRHSFASHLVSRGAPLYQVGALMGHTQAATTQRYAHIANSALRDVANVFDNVFGNNVVEIKAKKKTA
jgi:integrase